MRSRNLFDNIPDNIPEEIFEDIINHENVRIERIISSGQTTPAGQWYDQDQNEWVMVLKGEAGLEFENGQTVDLKEGDCINIPAHKKHRVSYTNKDEETVWLAVFY